MVEARILIVDDEPAMLENVQRLLAVEGLETRALGDALRFREEAEAFRPDVVLTDIRMPGADGMTILAASLADDASRPVILMTAFASVTSAVTAIREGAFDYITKPFTGEQLLVAVERAARFRMLSAENRALRSQIGSSEVVGGILGASAPVRRLHQQLRRLAPADVSVLITGESGTGKELVARALHDLSARRNKPFVTVDCTAIPEGLLESELFGHERGAFTGAQQRRDGLLLQAQGGTVFFDEVGDLPMALQAKLLRVLEQRRIRRLGDAKEVELDVRVLAATNVDLTLAVSEGRFREDLFYRLEVVHLQVPALRERDSDLEVLADAFLSEFAVALHREPPRIAPDVWPLLARYPWPGNIRELRNLMQRLVVMDEDGVVTRNDLPETVRYGMKASAAPQETEHQSYDEALELAVRRFREGYVRRLLERCGGNVTQAAIQAGVSRRTLHRWLADIQPSDAGVST